jgi:PAS domain S-box-containing protein
MDTGFGTDHQFYFAGMTLAAPLTLHLSLTMTRRTGIFKCKPWLFIPFYMSTVIFLPLSIFNVETFYQNKFILNIFLLTFGIYTVLGLYFILSAHVKATGIYKSQLWFFFIGMDFLIISTMAIDYPLWLGGSNSGYFSVNLFPIVIFCFGYGIVRYGLLSPVSRGLKKAYDNMNEGVVIIDIEGNIQDINNSALDLMDLTGIHVYDENIISLTSKKQGEKNYKYLGELLSEFMKSTEVWIERDLAIQPANEFIMNVRVAEITNRHNERIGYLILLQNITNKRVLEQNIIESEKMAGLGILASGMAHEINNPLAGIIGYAEAIMDETNILEIKEHSTHIIDASDKISNVVKWLSDYSYRAKETDFVEVDINKIIKESQMAIAYSRNIGGITIETQTRSVPPIKGDRNEIQQVLVNIITNAIDAVDGNGNIKIMTDSDDYSVNVQITDDGIGIPKEYIGRISEPFFTTKSSGSGTGLGMYVVSMIMGKHKGSVYVNSDVGEGTTFTLRFPLSGAQTGIRMKKQHSLPR